ncbi:MAG TPA: UDP-3-O-(3-hydroxymyristoyl)glucosamine N-acyltransferase [Candidatus Marinimicrobia bacterium]|nr:UDP-3-O-(3-hydroxymyristoyl)glucosamine N-acyltransferase [Candidatus Neomarinimicrobiota bacterium]HRS52554.1 UDP-3-O-(3-hydroxymyristoyl)glucosamine N-acyltransferase [Candidatus Neomarinimicrobiota bacterium]HRU93155.1 UDP-3-O-(3-hydroxymyristoyl)glucosamine N-acyltransferase [Candidatus Neomarinimicrobiota bacterium]
MQLTLGQIARLVDGAVKGDENVLINDVAEIQHAQSGTITFLANPKYGKYLASTLATAVIVDENFNGNFPNLILVKNPNLAFSIVLARFRPELPLPTPMIHSTAVIAKDAKIGSDVYIGPFVVVESGAEIGDRVTIMGNCYIGQYVIIGSETVIFSNVSIYHKCVIGQKVRIHSGVVIGSDGFGFVRVENGIEKIPQAGRVVIHDEVEIGANSTIDRGTIGDTVIGRGTKLDNLVQIAHNVRIGEYCFFAAQVGIAGSTIIEDQVSVGGQVGIAGHLHIGSGVMIAAQSGVTKDVPAGIFLFGSPAQERLKAAQELAHIRSLPEIKERLKKVEMELQKRKNIG